MMQSFHDWINALAPVPIEEVRVALRQLEPSKSWWDSGAGNVAVGGMIAIVAQSVSLLFQRRHSQHDREVQIRSAFLEKARERIESSLSLTEVLQRHWQELRRAARTNVAGAHSQFAQEAVMTYSRLHWQIRLYAPRSEAVALELKSMHNHLVLLAGKVNRSASEGTEDPELVSSMLLHASNCRSALGILRACLEDDLRAEENALAAFARASAATKWSVNVYPAHSANHDKLKQLLPNSTDDIEAVGIIESVPNNAQEASA